MPREIQKMALAVLIFSEGFEITLVLTWKYRTNSTGMTPNGAIPVAQTLLRWRARK